VIVVTTGRDAIGTLNSTSSTGRYRDHLNALRWANLALHKKAVTLVTRAGDNDPQKK